jgi:hypothetical protein
MSDNNLPVEREFRLGALRLQQKAVMDELTILRQTRGQRTVGEVKVPSHLASPDRVMLSASRAVDPRSCATCGNGLRGNERGPHCNRCINSFDTDAGVENRAMLASVLPSE